MGDVKTAAFFDLDKTVIAKSSALAFRGPMFRAGLLSRRALLKFAIAQTLYVLFGADHHQMERVREALLTLVRGWDRAELEKLVGEALEDVVAPLVFSEALFLIDEHHREGHQVYIISSSPTEIVRPLAAYLGIDNVIATQVGVGEDGKFTGELDFYAYGPGKAEAVRRLAESEGIDLSASFAYSDSFTDLPLLSAVGNPTVVNPDRELRKHAEEAGWPNLEFRLPVNLRTRLAEIPKPSPIVSGALAAAVAAAVVAIVLLRGRAKRA